MGNKPEFLVDRKAVKYCVFSIHRVLERHLTITSGTMSMVEEEDSFKLYQSDKLSFKNVFKEALNPEQYFCWERSNLPDYIMHIAFTEYITASSRIHCATSSSQNSFSFTKTFPI